MKDYIGERVIELAHYIAENKSTVRATAKKYNISKSTIHKDLTFRLPEIDSALFERVRQVLDKNKAERHLRGGMATKEKYMEIKYKR